MGCWCSHTSPRRDGNCRALFSQKETVDSTGLCQQRASELQRGPDIPRAKNRPEDNGQTGGRRTIRRCHKKVSVKQRKRLQPKKRWCYFYRGSVQSLAALWITRKTANNFNEQARFVVIDPVWRGTFPQDADICVWKWPSGLGGKGEENIPEVVQPALQQWAHRRLGPPIQTGSQPPAKQFVCHLITQDNIQHERKMVVKAVSRVPQLFCSFFFYWLFSSSSSSS